MGFKTFGFGFGREDIWEPEEIFWGPEDTWLGDERYSGDRELAGPLGAVQMGLIYVNPEGPNGNPDPLAAARDIRETFRRMAMNDEETVALIAGGHTFGKTHGAGDGRPTSAPSPRAAPIDAQGLGWKSTYGTGKGADTITSGLEVTWTTTPTQWGNGFFDNLFGHEWELTKSPAGAHQWVAKDAEETVPDAHDPDEEAPPDDADDRPRAALRPGVREDLAALPREPRRVRAGVRQGLVQAAAPRHGPGLALPRPVGPGAAAVAGPGAGGRPRAGRRRRRRRRSRTKLLDSGLTVSQLASTAWASAASFRGTDKRGGANGARIRLEPQRSWEVNEPAELAKVLQTLEQVQQEFNGAQSGGKQVSLADLIVLGGCAAVEKAARNAGHDVTVPFRPGRTDATQEQTDVESFAVLEPRADGFRNYLRAGEKLPPETLLLDRAYMLNLTAPEMTVLVGGLRALGTNVGGTRARRPHRPPGGADQRLLREPARAGHGVEGVGVRRRTSTRSATSATGEVRWTATAVDLVFGSNSQLRAHRGGLRQRRRAGEVRRTTSSPPGSRSWTSTGSTCADPPDRLGRPRAVRG